jgi:hypothetical protein
VCPFDTLQLSLDYWDITQGGKFDGVPFGFLYTSFCYIQ